MTLAPRLRRVALVVHVACSVGWLGAVAAVLAVAAIALASDDARTVRGAYLVLEPAAWFLLVPLAFASLLSGLVQALGTRWGLFRHWWVVFKLAINLVANAVLLLYTQTLGELARLAEENADLERLRTPSVVLHAAAALALLLVATFLGVYKPRGVTPHGRRTQRGRALSA